MLLRVIQLPSQGGLWTGGRGLPAAWPGWTLGLIPRAQGGPTKRQSPPLRGAGWGSARVRIIIDYNHNNRVFHTDTASPADCFAHGSCVPSARGALSAFSGRAWGHRCSRREMLWPLLVVLAESTAQLLQFSFSLVFYTIFSKALCSLGK